MKRNHVDSLEKVAKLVIVIVTEKKRREKNHKWFPRTTNITYTHYLLNV